MRRRRSLINHSAVKRHFASAGFRTSREVLEYLDAIVEAAIRSGIRGMTGRGKRTVTVEEIGRGKLISDWKEDAPPSSTPKKNRQVPRGRLRR
jgi:hypothetical protein